MELKRHLDLRYVFVGLYVLFIVVYVVIGLQSADAIDYEISADLEIPAIGLESGVTKLTLQDGRLNTPDTIVGSFSRAEHTTLLIGHSTTVFRHLDSVRVSDEIKYDYESYYVTNIEVEPKAGISMSKLLKDSSADTLVLMTCAGELLDNGDATHRLIITAVKY